MKRFAALLLSTLAAVCSATQPSAPVFLTAPSTLITLPYACDTTHSPPTCSYLSSVTNPPAWALWQWPTTNADGSAITLAQEPLTANVYGCVATDGAVADCAPVKLVAYRLPAQFVFVSALWQGNGFLYCLWVSAVDQQLNESALSSEVCLSM